MPDQSWIPGISDPYEEALRISKSHLTNLMAIVKPLYWRWRVCFNYTKFIVMGFVKNFQRGSFLLCHHFIAIFRGKVQLHPFNCYIQNSTSAYSYNQVLDLSTLFIECCIRELHFRSQYLFYQYNIVWKLNNKMQNIKVVTTKRVSTMQT